MLLFGICTATFGESPGTLLLRNGTTNDLFKDNGVPTTYYQKRTESFIIKASPIQILCGDCITRSYSAGLGLEKQLKKNYSMYAGARYVFTDKNDMLNKKQITLDAEKVNGFAVDAEMRKYLANERSAMSGAYLSANLKSIYTQAEYQQSKVNRISTGLYLNIGWQEIFDSGIAFDIAIGLGVKYVTSNHDTNDTRYRVAYHMMDGGNKPYHKGASVFPFANLNLNLGHIINK